MKNKKIIYRNYIQKKYLNKKNSDLKKNYFDIFKKITMNLENTRDTFHALSKDFKFNFKMTDLRHFKKFKKIIIIGMGGSILGSEAIYNFLEKKIKKEFIFINNIDENKLYSIKKKINLNETLFIIISKSGNTIETISNLLALKIIKNNSKNIILISEKRDNPLYTLSKKMNLFHIEHKNYIGGRYSVLSEVGIVPAYLMGINITKLRQKLRSHFYANNNFFLKDSAIKMANLIRSNKIKNIIFFNYVPELNKFLYWCQQLIAESLGKKGKGILPLVSPAPKDHHSLLQLYLDGPKDKLFCVFCLDLNTDIKINSNTMKEKFKFLNKKSLSQIKKAQKNSFLKTLKKKNIPFREFIIKDFSEEALGELFSYFILETAIIGKLLRINPFDQPAVEQVKIYTKQKLK